MGDKRTVLETKQELLIPPLNGDASRPTPISVLQQAVASGANVDTLTKLLELHERWEANEARKAFEVAFAAFKAEAPRLDKTKEVNFGKGGAAYKYTPLDSIANTLGPILAKHGLSYNWHQESSKEAITVTCILRHTQGHSITNTLSATADSSGAKNAIQAIGSAVTYLRRYTLLGVLGMATSDEDMDGTTMLEAADFIEHMKDAGNIQELELRYKEAIKDALQHKSPKAIDLYMKARERREKELVA